MIKIIASDLDHTVLNEKSELTSYTQSVLEQVRKQGIHFIPCTARNYHDLPDYFTNNHLYPYVVCNNGGDIVDNITKKRILNHAIDIKTVKELLNILKQYSPYWTLSTNKGSFTLIDLYDYKLQEGTDLMYCEYLKTKRILVKSYEDILNDKRIQVYKVQTYLLDPSIKDKVKCDIESKLTNVGVTTSSLHNIEITDPLATKGNALRFIMNHINIDASSAMAFGDNYNDIPLIESVKYGYAVNNAVKELKECAIDVIDFNYNDGVAKKIMEHINK